MGGFEPIRRRRDNARRPERWVDACDGKRRYRDRQSAKSAAQIIRTDGGKELRPYPCQFCRGWHLTSQEFRGGG